tara:strand:+ start:379 stop:1587 length:1209 start_codon:yes stop_codon:yes gene_type:complete
MTANYKVNGIEYNWKTGRPIQSELIEDIREGPGDRTSFKGYGKDSAGDDFFLSYPLKRNENEDSLILQAVKYLAPKEGADLGFDINTKWNESKESIEEDNAKRNIEMTDGAVAALTQAQAGNFAKNIRMGAGMDSRYQGFAGDKHNAKTKFYVELPIPNELSDSQSVTWDANTMNAFEVVASSMAMSMMKEPGATAEAVQEAINAAKAGALAQDFGSEGKGNVGGAVRAALSGLGLQAFGSNVTPNSMISRSSGQILNSNKELLFEGVNLRNFSFNVTFAPRSKKESERVLKIIRSLKTSMSPKAGEEYVPGANNFKGSGGIFLNAPDIFLIKYLHKGGEHPFLHKFKPCALTSLNVNYTGSNVYSTYGDGTPTLIKMQMQFGEMNPIYAEDYAKAGKGVGY